MIDLETIKLLGTALGSIKALADIAATITNTQLRREVDAQIADLQNTVFTARQKLLELQQEYELVLEENTRLKATTVDADPCPRCGRKGWHVESSEPDAMFGELGAVRRLYKCEFCSFTESQVMTPK